MRMNKLRKHSAKLLVFAALTVSILFPSFFSRAAEVAEVGAKAIYVVFDNSGSMYGPGNTAWSQATYAMEVFAAMMNYENGDTMKIFPMHNVTTGGEGPTSSITVRAVSDISQIHNMYTPQPLGTPYTQVDTAAEALAAALDAGEVQEGWLVILTDGDFDSDLPDSSLQEDLEQKAQMREEIYVQYLAIGSDVRTVANADEELGLYAQKVESSAQVINELAVISNRIFERNEYTGLKEDGSLSFDIPLGRLIVFAQGSDVNISALKNQEGGEIRMETSYEVSCSNTDGGGLTSYVTETPAKDTSLKGQVAVFAGEPAIMEGQYTLDVSGADSINVYYEPNVRFGIALYRGEERMDTETIEGGSYNVVVGFVNQLTGEFIENTSLLGKPQYTLTINGESYGLGGEAGAYQSLQIQAEGDMLDVAADVLYLDSYRDHVEMSFQVCTLDMMVDAQETVNLKEIAGGAGSMTVTATKNGEPLTEEQWQNAVVSVECRDSEGEDFPILWDVQPGSQVSTWLLTPRYADGDMFSTGTGLAQITVRVSTEIDGQTYGRSETLSMEIKDDRTPLDYLRRYWLHITISLLVLILILGYVPPFKKRFPRKMKRKPSIQCESQKVGVKSSVVKGAFDKNMWSVILPYKAETGRLMFCRSPRHTAKVKASGGGRMEITNTQAFAGNENITFNGRPVPAEYRGNLEISANAFISVLTPVMIYTCNPTVKMAPDGSIKKDKKRNDRIIHRRKEI